MHGFIKPGRGPHVNRPLFWNDEVGVPLNSAGKQGESDRFWRFLGETLEILSANSLSN